MTPFIRWVKFNLVGAAGVLVQLAALSIFNSALQGRYLIASTAALELTLLHNFVWHRNYTWRDRQECDSWWKQLLNFHLSNGVVSWAGNIALMWLLVHRWHLPILLANAAAILCCSAANFTLSHCWTFSSSGHTLPASRSKERAQLASLLRALALVLFCRCSDASAQLPEAPPNQVQRTASISQSTQTSAAARESHRAVIANYAYMAGIFCGAGATTSRVATLPAVNCGAGISFPIAPFFLEVGMMSPQANRSYASAYLSADVKFPVTSLRNGYAPFAIIGYSRLFETGHALDYGIGLETPRHGRARREASKALLLELRDYWTFANPSQHNVMLRIGWIVGIPD